MFDFLILFIFGTDALKLTKKEQGILDRIKDLVLYDNYDIKYCRPDYGAVYEKRGIHIAREFHTYKSRNYPYSKIMDMKGWKISVYRWYVTVEGLTHYYYKSTSCNLYREVNNFLKKTEDIKKYNDRLERAIIKVECNKALQDFINKESFDDIKER